MDKPLIARQQSGWRVISLAPDVCKTPGSMAPVPYPVVANLDEAVSVVERVRANGFPVVVYNLSYVPKTIGDKPGKGGGLISQTVEGDCWPIDHSQTVCVTGKPLVREGDLFWMNGNYASTAEPTKAERWAARQELIAQGKQSDDPEMQAAAERFEQNNYAVERAKLSQHVYDPDNPVPEGWTNISNDPEALAKYGLKPEDLSIPDSDFGAQVYAPGEFFGEDMKPTVVFEGTSSLEDWKNNINQGINRYSPYYERAVDIGNKLRRSGADVHIAGHSLGGGMASTASVASGAPATTFNAAGLHSKTVGRYGGTVHTTDIDAYRVKGEVLTDLQEPGLLRLLTSPGLWGLGKAMPKAVGTPHELPRTKFDRVRRHFMDDVIGGIEKQKEEDQAILKGESGQPGGGRRRGRGRGGRRSG